MAQKVFVLDHKKGIKLEFFGIYKNKILDGFGFPQAALVIEIVDKNLKQTSLSQCHKMSRFLLGHYNSSFSHSFI